MWARFVRFCSFPDKAYKQKPVAEKLKLTHVIKGKIYCQGCKWLVSASSGYTCHHESNKVFTKNNKTEWYSPALDHSLREHPQQKNRRNDCPHKEKSAV